MPSLEGSCPSKGIDFHVVCPKREGAIQNGPQQNKTGQLKRLSTLHTIWPHGGHQSFVCRMPNKKKIVDKFCELFGVSWVFKRTCDRIVQSWLIQPLSPEMKAFWIIIPTVVLWFGRKERYSRIFENKESEESNFI